MIYTKIVIKFIISLCLTSSFLFSIDYLIISADELSQAAYSISNIYNNNEKTYYLNTEVVLTSDIDIDINTFISNRITSDNNIRYLLLIGDENNFPYLYKTLTCNEEGEQEYPSDDLYSSVNEHEKPRLATGRIPASNIDQAMNFANKLENYLENSDIGYWKNKLILVSDDEIKAGSSISNEIRHTEYSNDIYNLISDMTFIETLYGPMYEATYNGSFRKLPELTNDIISSLNNGAALINYIGHGDTEKWAAEHIIDKDRDIQLINIQNNKLPIWMAGTCYFGRYDNTESISESLLFDTNAAISIIGATRAIRIDINKRFLDNFYTGIKNYIENSNNNSRLGDIFIEAKNQLTESDYLGTETCPDNGGYLFDILGDPALPLPFAKTNEEIVSFPDEIELLNTIEIEPLNNNDYNYIEIYSSNNDVTLIFEEDNQNIDLTFSFPNIMYKNTFSNYNCYTPPIDLISYENIKMKYYSDSQNGYNAINNSNQININNLSAEDYGLFNDLTSPEISFWVEDIKILNNSYITSNNTIDILILDPLDINTSKNIGHTTKFWFSGNMDLINEPEVMHIDSCKGITFSIDTNLESTNTLYIETWDSANNKALDSLIVYSESEFKNKDILNVYNFPNPFSERTFFTYQIKDIPSSNVQTKLAIYTQNGIVINTIKNIQKNNFISIEWDGKDYQSNLVPNGTYIYTLDIKVNNKSYNERGVLSIIR